MDDALIPYHQAASPQFGVLRQFLIRVVVIELVLHRTFTTLSFIDEVVTTGCDPIPEGSVGARN